MQRFGRAADWSVFASSSIRTIPGRILGLWLRGDLDIVTSQYIADELDRVLLRFTRLDLQLTEVKKLMLTADIVQPDAEREVGLRDESDQLVLATFRAARANYLITGDKDLLTLADKYPVLTPAAFWSRHG